MVGKTCVEIERRVFGGGARPREGLKVMGCRKAPGISVRNQSQGPNAMRLACRETELQNQEYQGANPGEKPGSFGDSRKLAFCPFGVRLKVIQSVGLSRVLCCEFAVCLACICASPMQGNEFIFMPEVHAETWVSRPAMPMPGGGEGRTPAQPSELPLCGLLCGLFRAPAVCASVSLCRPVLDSPLTVLLLCCVRAACVPLRG